MADVRERKKITRAIEKTSESIRKKHRSLKTDRIEEGIALDRHFTHLIEPLRLFANSPGVRATKRELRDEDTASVHKHERKKEENPMIDHTMISVDGRAFDLVDHVYGVYLHKDGLMFGNKRFDVDDADNIIIDGVQYAGTPGL
ncbi:hypothetical protein ALC56_15329 [Trachymyrmex septentrionalis]|uniref:DUF8207 domain-containing protein n=1 Tax=Trachymyrmex septentrionalis TaxID=34720 RepID=A0A195ER91_9HYME|nr:hypothetical protein ALC56_15329 [Trachymyrmex septentrionalis]